MTQHGKQEGLHSSAGRSLPFVLPLIRIEPTGLFDGERHRK
jgi:hypothetical protein